MKLKPWCFHCSVRAAPSQLSPSPLCGRSVVSASSACTRVESRSNPASMLMRGHRAAALKPVPIDYRAKRCGAAHTFKLSKLPSRWKKESTEKRKITPRDEAKKHPGDKFTDAEAAPSTSYYRHGGSVEPALAPAPKEPPSERPLCSVQLILAPECTAAAQAESNAEASLPRSPQGAVCVCVCVYVFVCVCVCVRETLDN